MKCYLMGKGKFLQTQQSQYLNLDGTGGKSSDMGATQLSVPLARLEKPGKERLEKAKVPEMVKKEQE